MLRSVMSRCVPCYTEWKCTTYYLLTYYYLYNIGVSGCYALSVSSITYLLTYFLLLIAYTTLVCRDATLCPIGACPA
jgi:hypothetical protein